MTSLAGFEALLRNVRVVCHGLPFYAGWGLTTDRVDCRRRTKNLTLDELVFGVLITYPRYINAGKSTGKKVFIEPEQLIDQLAVTTAGKQQTPGWRRKSLRLLLALWATIRINDRP